MQVTGTVQNGAVLRAGAAIEDNTGRRTRATAETRVQAGVPLHLTMELNPDPAQPGELVNGLLTVTNTGPIALLGVEVEVFIPDEVAPFTTNRTSGASASCSGDGNPAVCSARERLVWTVGALPAGVGVTLAAPLGLATDVSVGGRVVTFNARADETNGFTAAARRSLRVESSRVLDLAVEEDAEPVVPNQALTYRLNFGNRAAAALAPGTVLRFPVPAGVDFVSASDGGLLSAAGVVEWTPGTLNPGQTGSREVAVLVKGTVQNGAVLRAGAAIDDNTGRRTRAAVETRVQTGVPLHLTMELNPDPVQPGELVNGLLTVTNTGPITLLGVEVEVFIPDEVAPFTTNRTSGPSASCSGDGNPAVCSARERLVWTVGALPAGTGVTLGTPLGLATDVSVGRVVAFNARADEAGGFTAAARRSLRVESSRLLDLAVDEDADPVAPGGELSYRLSFGNQSTTTAAQGTLLRLALPAGAEFVSATDGGAFIAGGVEWMLGTLNKGDAGSREVVVQVDAALPSGAVLCAAATIDDDSGRRTRATVETRAQAGVPLPLTIEVTPDPAQPGALLSGMLTVKNTGPIALLGVQVEVFLPDEIALFATNQTSGASATCIGDGNPAACSARERLVWAVGTLASGGMAQLTMSPHFQAAVVPGRVVTFNARAAENGGVSTAARRSIRVQTP